MQVSRASRTIGIDLNKAEFDKALGVGATDCVSPKDSTKTIGEVLSELTGNDVGYTFEVIGHLETMMQKEQLFLTKPLSCEQGTW